MKLRLTSWLILLGLGHRCEAGCNFLFDNDLVEQKGADQTAYGTDHSHPEDDIEFIQNESCEFSIN